MVKVEIYRLNNDGTQKIIAVCRLENNLVVCDGEEPFLDYLSKEGIKNYSVMPPVKISLKDGKLFLEQLKNNFKSGYLNASEIIED